MDEAMGLSELLRPIRSRLGAAVGLQAVAAVVAVVPFAAVAELARVLLADGPVDASRAWTVAAVAAGALVVWVLLTGLAGVIAHHADLDFDATTGVLTDGMYTQLAESYVLEKTNQDFMRHANPWALRGIVEKLHEAVDRGLWAEPDPELLAQMQQVYLEVEGDLEDGGG